MPSSCVLVYPCVSLCILVYAQFCFLLFFFFRKRKTSKSCLLEVGPSVKVVHKNWYRAVSYSILQLYDARNAITVDNQKYAIINFYVLLTVHPNIMIVFFYQLDAKILHFNTFIIFVYMFRALLCSSSGGQLSYTTSGIVTLFRWLFSTQVPKQWR